METCTLVEVLGVFPIITGMSCNDYAIMLSGSALIGGYLFWEQVTK